MFRCHGFSLPVAFLALCLVLVGCGDDGVAADSGADDLGSSDLGVDLGASDLGDTDLGPVDAGPPDLAGCPDLDGDGHASSLCGGDDCDDADAARFPGNAELCDAPGHDEDCNDLTFGDLDVDGDGAVSSACCGLRSGVLECAPDCDDARADVGFRSAQEICDGIDNDCDGAVDEASVAIPWYRDLDADGFGDASAPTTLSCAPPSGYAVIPFDCDDRSSAVSPAVAEACNGRDDDCDGAIDEGACTPLPDGGVPDGGALDGGALDGGAPCDRCIWSCVAERCDDAIRLGTHAFGGCAARERGGLVCWGHNGYGQVGDGSGFPSQPRPVEVALPNVVQVAGGYLHVCAVTAAGALYCWGDNSAGQLGVGDEVQRDTPALVYPSGVIEVSAGGAHTCARLSSGELRCWGDNTFGQLGIDTAAARSSTPVVVRGSGTDAALLGVVFVRAGGEHTCASTGAALYCWGNNSSGQLGIGIVASSRSRPALAMLPYTAVSCAVGDYHSCAVDRRGELYCWGRGMRGGLGTGTEANADRPQHIVSMTNAVEVVGGAYHTCVRRRDGTVWCIGGNAAWELGDGVADHGDCPATEDCSHTWVQAVGVANSVSISSMGQGACAFIASGQILCWGRNAYGALGAGDETAYTVPHLVTTP